MDSRNKQISKERVAEYVSNHAIEFIRTFAKYTKMDFWDTESHVSAASEIPHPILNSVLEARLTSDTIKDELEAIMAPFKEKNHPVFWYTWPTSTPADLSDHLLAYGFTLSHHSPAMLADLSKLPAKTPLPDNVRIEYVSNDAMLNDWMKPLIAGFQLPEMVNDFFHDCFKKIGYSEDIPVQNYVAYLDDEPATCATLFLDKNNIAGIWDVATMPQARKKGLGTAITWAGCDAARKKGYEHAVLLASEMGYPIYEKLGFEEYFKAGYYLWQPPEET